MKKLLFLATMLVIPSFLVSPAQAERARKWDSHQEYIFQPNVLYAVTYVIDERESRMLESAYFKQIWSSPLSASEHAFVDPASSVPQEHYKRFYLAEFWKEYPDGRQESYLIPVRNIVEVRHLVRESSKKK